MVTLAPYADRLDAEQLPLLGDELLLGQDPLLAELGQLVHLPDSRGLRRRRRVVGLVRLLPLARVRALRGVVPGSAERGGAGSPAAHDPARSKQFHSLQLRSYQNLGSWPN